MSNLDIDDEAERGRALRDVAVALWPTLEARAGDSDELCQIPDETFSDLRDAGLTRLTQPRRYGGAELPLGAAVDALAALAGGCGSSAWVCGVYADHACMLGMFSELCPCLAFTCQPSALSNVVIRP